MSSDGVVSVRLPLSLLGAFRAAAERQGITIHEAARRVVSFLPTVPLSDLANLREPTREHEQPKVSLYVGWRAVDILMAATRENGLTNSAILRRMLNGFLVSNEVKFVQQGDHWELKIMRGNDSEKSSLNLGSKAPSCA
jgi:hypothetical protein